MKTVQQHHNEINYYANKRESMKERKNERTRSFIKGELKEVCELKCKVKIISNCIYKDKNNA